MNLPKIIKIKNITCETYNVKTILFNYQKEINPGQFFMVWIPGVDEIPMSVSYIKDDVKGVTFKQVGDATNSLGKLKIGDKIGIRGPYGSGFNLKYNNILFIAGGTGIATITPAAIYAKDDKKHVKVIIGAKTKKDIFFEQRLKDSNIDVFVSTDDGSYGFKGLATDLSKKIFAQDNYDSIITCGPEIMMKALLDYFDNVFFQASLERYMKCAIGICGQCCIGDGLRVCKEGPVFDGKTLKNINDFGIYRRDSAGRKVRF